MKKERESLAVRVGERKSIAFATFFFACLGVSAAFPYNIIISGTDWFHYILPDAENISGSLASANFVASVVTTLCILAAASPKDVKEETQTKNPKKTIVKRTSSIYEAFTKGVKVSLSLHTRIYIGLVLEAVPLLLFALIYPSKGLATALTCIVGIGDATTQSGVYPLAGRIHPRCTAIVALGSAVAGFGAGLFRLFTKLVFHGTETAERISSSIYFLIAFILIVWCGFAHFTIKKYKVELKNAFSTARSRKKQFLHSIPVDSVYHSVLSVRPSLLGEPNDELKAKEDLWLSVRPNLLGELNDELKAEEDAKEEEKVDVLNELQAVEAKEVNEEVEVQNELQAVEEAKEEEDSEVQKHVSNIDDEELFTWKSMRKFDNKDDAPASDLEKHEVLESFVFNDDDPETDEQATPKTNKVFRLFSVFFDASLVYREALTCAWIPVLSQFLNFALTLSLFPGLVLSMKSPTLGSYKPVILVTAFNIGGTVGRFLPMLMSVTNWMTRGVGDNIMSKNGEQHIGNRRPKMKYVIALPLLLRFSFYPLIIFCVNPLYITSDVARIVIVMFLGISNGWVFSSCYMFAPLVCCQLKHKEAAALLMILSTLLAQGIGSFLGLIVVDGICGEGVIGGQNHVIESCSLDR